MSIIHDRFMYNPLVILECTFVFPQEARLIFKFAPGIPALGMRFDRQLCIIRISECRLVECLAFTAAV